MNKNIQTNNGEVSNTESNSLEQKVLCDKCDKEFLESELKYHMDKTFGGYYCKDCLIKTRQKEIDDQVSIWDFSEGDYNDVYQRLIIKGTSQQVDEFCKSFLSEEGLERAEDSGDADIGYMIYYEQEEKEDEDNEDMEEILVEYFATASQLYDIDDPENHYKDEDIDIDLTKQEDEKEETESKCDICDAVINEDDDFHNVGELVWCCPCFHKQFKQCNRCEYNFPKEHLEYNKEIDDWLCVDCLKTLKEYEQ